MDFVILDLEWNGSYSKKAQKFINEIFEFGAVRINSDMEIVDTFSMLIKPQISRKICSRVKNLTHIDTDQLANTNNTYNHVVKLFSAFSKNAVIMTWGTTDIQTLMMNNEYYNKRIELSFLKQYIDLQSYCEYCLNKQDPSKQMGLSVAAEIIGLDIDNENLHHALGDSILAYRCFKELYSENKLKSFIQNVDNEFYKKVNFKNTMITDFENPLIDKNEFYALCPTCQSKGKRLTKWQVKNKSFRADFLCSACNTEFNGRVRFKLKYDGVQIKHTSSPIEITKQFESSQNMYSKKTVLNL